MVNNNLTCLFRFHNYSTELTKDKNGFHRHLCTICKRSGHIKFSDTYEYWYEYDDKDNRIYMYDSNGREQWLHDDGSWVDKKPGNWKYVK